MLPKGLMAFLALVPRTARAFSSVTSTLRCGIGHVATD